MSDILCDDFRSITESQPDDLFKFVNTNIVLTGASGFVGKWIVGSWLMACEMLGGTGRILLTCRRPDALVNEFPKLVENKRVEFFASDIRSLNVDLGFKPDTLIHAATAASESLNLTQPMEMIDVIVSGTRQALKFAEDFGVNKFVNLSSGAVYGTSANSQSGFCESDKTAPDLSNGMNAYHEAKRLAELLVLIECDRLKISSVSLRLFAFLAPFLPLDTHFAAGNFLRQASLGQDIVVRSDGRSIRSYQYGTDLARYLICATVRNLNRRAYNVGSPIPISIKDLAFAIRDQVFPAGEVKVLGANSSPSDTHYFPSTDLIKQEINIQKEVPIHEAINRTFRWIVSKPVNKNRS